MPSVPEYRPLDQAISFSEGDEAAFAWFFRELYPSLCFFAHRITGDQQVSEEIAADAFLKIWERHEQFSSPEGIRAYLYQVVKNDALKCLQKSQRAAKALVELSILNGKETDLFQHLVAAETGRQLRNTIDLLPPECSKVFRLLYVEGKTVKEIAEMLKLSPSTIKSQKARGLALIRTRMAGFLRSIF